MLLVTGHTAYAKAQKGSRAQAREFLRQLIAFLASHLQPSMWVQSAGQAELLTLYGAPTV